jgi:hypothetical protein
MRNAYKIVVEYLKRGYQIAYYVPSNFVIYMGHRVLVGYDGFCV